MPESPSKQSARNDSGEIATSTLAEIYAQQGLIGRALSIYRRMLARAPEDTGIADRIRSLEVRMAEVGPEPQAEPTSGPPAGRERLPWDPPEPEAATPVDPPPSAEQTAAPGDPAAPSTEQAAAPGDHVPATGEPASEVPAVALQNEPEAPSGDSPRRARRMDAEAFRSWLDGR